MEGVSLEKEAGGAIRKEFSLMNSEHGFSERQWLEFLDGTIEPAEQAQVLEHLAGCADCATLASELVVWRTRLLEEGQGLREAFSVPEEAFQSMLSSSIERIRSAEPAGVRSSFGWTAAEGIIVLRFLMEPICGPGTARATIELAVQRSAGEGSRVTGSNWRLFVGNLSDAAAWICGSAFGRLVYRAGLGLAIEEG